jgi:hypothetical protein
MTYTSISFWLPVRLAYPVYERFSPWIAGRSGCRIVPAGTSPSVLTTLGQDGFRSYWSKSTERTAFAPLEADARCDVARCGRR